LEQPAPGRANPVKGSIAVRRGLGSLRKVANPAVIVMVVGDACRFVQLMRNNLLVDNSLQ
jgi:hypothetical protein